MLNAQIRLNCAGTAGMGCKCHTCGHSTLHTSLQVYCVWEIKCISRANLEGTVTGTKQYNELETTGCPGAVNQLFWGVFLIFWADLNRSISFRYSWTTGMKNSWEILSPTPKKVRYQGWLKLTYILIFWFMNFGHNFCKS